MSLPFSLLIVTRNNPCALCALLGSVIAQFTDPEERLTLYLGDSSDRPVLFDPSIARLLAMFEVVYKHFRVPEVNAQRLEMLSSAKDEQVLCLDDDLLLLPQHLHSAIAASEVLEYGTAISGVTVDTTNEKGYPDYRVSAEASTSHCFGNDFASWKIAVDPTVCEFSATVGHMLVHARAFFDALLTAARYTQEPSLVDDAAATLLARGGGPNFCVGMRAWHTGNSNKWWSKWGHKRFAVNAVVERAKV